MTPITWPPAANAGVGQDAHQADVPRAIDDANAALGQVRPIAAAAAAYSGRDPALEPQKTQIDSCASC